MARNPSPPSGDAGAEALAQAIYVHHRRGKLRAKRRKGPVPTWDELDAGARETRVRAAASYRAQLWDNRR